ncbi:hypothetical protein ACF0H5_019924 [Mactra antiquata]
MDNQDVIPNDVISKRFGTLQGTEPLFGQKEYSVSKEMLKEWTDLFLNNNSVAIKNAVAIQGVSFTPDCVEFLFLTCDRLKMPNEVKYLSLELYDRFMNKHVEELYNHVKESGQNKATEWNEIMKRVKNQVELRIVSCIQISSKLTSHHRILGPTKARRLLLDAGRRYSKESLLLAELRVLKTLNYHVSVPSSLTYLDFLLETLSQTDINVDVHTIREVALQFLDTVYLQYTHMYTCLHQITSGGFCPFDEEKFAPVKADKLLLTATVVTAAAYALKKESHEAVLITLSKVTRIPPEEIADFTSIVIQTLLKSTES